MAVRRFSNLDRLRLHHDVAGNMFAVGGTLYAVILGLVVVDAIGTFETARTTVEKEADAIANVVLLAERLPADKSAAIKSLCERYILEAVDGEWPLMNQGKVDEKAQNLVVQLLREVSDFEPVTENQKIISPLLIQRSLDLMDQRRARIGISLNGLPSVEWLVLCVGAIVTIVLTYFFHLESYRTQLAMTALIALLIALNLYLVLLFAAPFTGDLTVSAGVFGYVLSAMRAS